LQFERLTVAAKLTSKLNDVGGQDRLSIALRGNLALRPLGDAWKSPFATSANTNGARS